MFVVHSVSQANEAIRWDIKEIVITGQLLSEIKEPLLKNKITNATSSHLKELMQEILNNYIICNKNASNYLFIYKKQIEENKKVSYG